MSKEKGKKVSVNCPKCEESFIITNVKKGELKEGINTTCPECEKEVEIYEDNFIEFIFDPRGINLRIFAFLFDFFLSLLLLFPVIVIALFIIPITLIGFLLIIFPFVFYTILDSNGRLSPGKNSVNLKVITIDGEDINKSTAFFRFFILQVLFPLVPIINLFTMLFTEKKLGLHDVITNTRVIYTKDR